MRVVLARTSKLDTQRVMQRLTRDAVSRLGDADHLRSVLCLMSDAKPDTDNGWPPREVRRFNRVLNVLECLAAALLPDLIYPRVPGEPSEERRLSFVTWAVIAACVGVLAIGAWLTGLIPPGNFATP